MCDILCIHTSYCTRKSGERIEADKYYSCIREHIRGGPEFARKDEATISALREQVALRAAAAMEGETLATVMKTLELGTNIHKALLLKGEVDSYRDTLMSDKLNVVPEMMLKAVGRLTKTYQFVWDNFIAAADYTSGTEEDLQDPPKRAAMEAKIAVAINCLKEYTVDRAWPDEVFRKMVDGWGQLVHDVGMFRMNKVVATVDKTTEKITTFLGEIPK